MVLSLIKNCNIFWIMAIDLLRKERFGMQLGGTYLNADMLEYTKQCFTQFFKNDILKKSEDYGNEAAGFFDLIYLFIPKQYILNFNYENFAFSIHIRNDENGFTSLKFINDKKTNTSLSKENIYKSVEEVSKIMYSDEYIQFYKIGKKGRIPIEEDRGYK